MRSVTTRAFRTQFRNLPEQVRRQARAAYRLFQSNPRHPSLQFKRLASAGESYSVRIGLHYRALAIRDGNDLVWFWIGHHAEYDRQA